MLSATSYKKIIFLLLLISTLFMLIPAAAEDGPILVKPITEIYLGVKEVTMNVGETRTLPLTYEPAESPHALLNWYTDETVIKFNPDDLSVTALSAGKTRLLIESNLGFAWAYCDITVNGNQAKALEQKTAGAEMITLNAADRSKIKALTVNNYLAFLENSSFTTAALQEAAERGFNITVEVKDGSEEKESQLAASLGMEKAVPLPDLDAVSLYGTIAQIIAFVNNNPDLIEVFEFAPFQLEDTTLDYDSEDLSAKAMNLKSNVEWVTSVSKAHNLGLKGDGYAVAIIDTGINKNHEQFKGRVVADECMALANNTYYKSCKSGSSAPSQAVYPYLHNHGSHVAGIAVGRDGIAPNAKIISFNISVEYYYNGYYYETLYFDSYQVAQTLVNLQKSLSTPIVAANMSYGGGSHSSVCDNYDDSTKYQEKAAKLLLNNGIIPVVCSHNQGYAGYIAAPSCTSSSFAVGSLTDSTSALQIATYSNHSTLVDILAPGTNVLSAFYAYESGSSTNYCSTGGNCYGKYSGTSMATPMVSGAFALLKQANPAMSAAQLKTQIKEMSTKTAKYRPAGYVYRNGRQTYIYAETFSYSKPVLDFSKITKVIPFTLEDSRVRGKNKEIIFSIPYTSKMADSSGSVRISWKLYNMDTQQWVTDPTTKLRFDSTGKNLLFNFTGSRMVNGQVYRIHLWKYEMVNGKYTQSAELVKYGMPIANVYGATVVAGNKTMVINNKHREPTSGARYMIFDGSTQKELAFHFGTKNNTSWTYSDLKNGKLYYAVAVPYRSYKNQMLWGPNQNRIYFIPMTAPANGKVTFTNSTTAVVSIASDSLANGIRVLYRTTGGKLMNGCESTGSSCTIKNLSSSKGYEFYAMKYKTASSKKYYSMGTLITYKSTASGLSAPQSNPTVAMNNSGYTSFTIKLSSNAKGISVLYRIGEGNFVQACESASNSCSATLDTSKRYTFYIMQYRVVNGMKVYSPGIIARDFSSGKSIDAERLYKDFEVADDSLYAAEIAGALDDYITEDMLLMAEANRVMGISSGLDELLAADSTYGKAVNTEDDFNNDVEIDWNLNLDNADVPNFAPGSISVAADVDHSKIKLNTITIKVNELASKGLPAAESYDDDRSGLSLYRLDDPYEGSTWVPSFPNK